MKKRTARTCHLIRKDGREIGHAQVLEGQEYVLVRGNSPTVYQRSEEDDTQYHELDSQYVQLSITGEHVKSWRE